MESLSPPLLPVAATKSSETADNAATIDTAARGTPVTLAEQTSVPHSAQAPSLSIAEEDYDLGAIYRQVTEIRKAQAKMLSNVERPTPLSLRLAMGQVAGSVQQAEKALNSTSNVSLPTSTSDLAFKKANRVSTFYAQSALETQAQTISNASSQLTLSQTSNSAQAQPPGSGSQTLPSSETTQHSALDRARQAYTDTEHVTPDNSQS